MGWLEPGLNHSKRTEKGIKGRILAMPMPKENRQLDLFLRACPLLKINQEEV